MSHNAPEMGQGEKTLTKAAGMVADAKADFDGFSRKLDGQIAGPAGQVGGRRWARRSSRCTRPGPRSSSVITNALNEFEASLTSTERDNISTDDAQSANYNRTAGRLGG